MDAAVVASETYQTLLARAARRVGRLPPERLVRHALTVARGGDWPVQREALEAILRRCASAQADEIQILARPRRQRPDLYVVQRRESRAPSYRVVVRGEDPIDGSCECPDFLRNSLGLCKHLIAVLEHVASDRSRSDGRGPIPTPAPVCWDPIRPLTGSGDWLARVRWLDGAPVRDLRRWFRPAGGRRWRIVVSDRRESRFTLVERLLAVLGDGDGEPALHALLRHEHARLARQMETAGARTALRRALRSLEQPLYPYQRDGVERFLSQGRLLLADDMGLGKSAQAIAICHALWHAGRVRRGLLVVPAALKPQWLREWRLFTDAPAAILRAAFFTGEEGQKRRTRNIVDFHDDPTCRVLFATDAGGVGLNLQRAASACINLELPWNPAVLEQRIGRIHRLGQQRPIDVYNLVSEPGIESRIADIVESKQALFKGLFDGTSDQVVFERSAGFLAHIEQSVVAQFTEAPSHAAGADLEETAVEREIDATLAAGDESLDSPAVMRPSAAPASEPLPSPGEIQRMVAGLTVRRSASGGLVIEAPPETASTLAALFSGIAQLLRASAGSR